MAKILRFMTVCCYCLQNFVTVRFGHTANWRPQQLAAEILTRTADCGVP